MGMAFIDDTQEFYTKATRKFGCSNKYGDMITLSHKWYIIDVTHKCEILAFGKKKYIGMSYIPSIYHVCIFIS